MILFKNQKPGFSFIEIMFAVVCIGLLLIPVYSIFSQSTIGAVQSRNEILAQQHGANLLAFLHLFPYDHKFLKVTRDMDFSSLELSMEGEALNLEPEKIFTRKLSIEEIQPSNWPRTYKIVTITVSWKELKGRQRELKICGLKYR